MSYASLHVIFGIPLTVKIINKIREQLPERNLREVLSELRFSPLSTREGSKYPRGFLGSNIGILNEGCDERLVVLTNMTVRPDQRADTLAKIAALPPWLDVRTQPEVYLVWSSS